MSGLFAKGTTLWKGNGASPEVFSKIGKVKSITGPGFSVKFVDGTTHDTTSNFDEPVAVQCSAGDLTFGVNYDPSDPTLAPATGLYDQMQNLARAHFQLRFAPSDSLHTRMNFTAFVASHPMTFAVDNLMEATIALKVDGAVVWDTF